MKIELVKLLDQEGTRKSQVALKELANGLEEVKTDGATIRTSNWASLLTTLLEALQKFGNWVAMSVFAGFLVYCMVGFLWAKDYTGAGHVKDLLMVMLGGTLGWIGKGVVSGRSKLPAKDSIGGALP